MAARRKSAPEEEIRKARKLGRPTAYDPSFNQMAHELALIQLDDRQMADVFGVSVATLNTWKIKYPAFLEALNDGKAPTDAKVGRSLVKQAQGYYQEVEKPYVINGKVKIVKYQEYFQPNPSAAIFWMKNRQRDKWRDVQRQELTGKDDGPIKTEATQTVILDASKLDPDARGLLREALKNAKG